MIKVSISIDDGRRDTYRAYYEILKQYNIPLTLNITTGYITKTIDKSDYPCQNEPLTMSELKDLIMEKNVEIAGHGLAHNNKIENLIEGAEQLNSILSRYNKHLYGIASPQSKLHQTEIDKNRSRLDKIGIQYFRTGDRKEEMSILRRCIRKGNRYTHIPFAFYLSDFPQFVKNNDNYIFYSNCILKNTTLKELKYTINKLQKDEANLKGCILNFHSILKPNEPYSEDLYSWDYDNFSSFCNFLSLLNNEGKIDLCLTKDMV